mmetsp:Transcript_40501/g.94041  ORF Transcript_40501/g.94041 Transcript_40501/m.94041 type:complete len:304 (+) Transcript_40501:33-944(+)
MPRGRGRGGAGRAATPDAGAAQAAQKEWRTPRKWKRAEFAEEWQKKELERLNCTKYHYLKFVEKKKVERRLNSCRRQLEAKGAEDNKAEVDALRKQLRSHLADHEYITYYPKHLPYNSLFPVQDSEASKKRRDEIRSMIRKQLTLEGVTSALDAGEPLEAEVARKSRKTVPSPKVSAEKKGSPEVKAAKKKQEEVADELSSPATAKAPTKKRKVKAAKPVKAEVSAKPLSARKLAKRPKRKAPEPVEEEAKPAKKVKAKKPKGAPDGKDQLHPSWAAAKNAKVSGAIVTGSADRKVFESDSEA